MARPAIVLAALVVCASVFADLAPPHVNSLSYVHVHFGEPLNYEITAAGDPAPTFSLPKGVPPELNLSFDGTHITGNPAAPGGWAISILAENSQGAEYFLLILYVDAGHLNPPIISFSGVPNNSIIAGQTLTVDASILDADGDHVTTYWSYGNNTGGDQGSIYNTPTFTHTFAVPGIYEIWLAAIDGQRIPPNGGGSTWVIERFYVTVTADDSFTFRNLRHEFDGTPKSPIVVTNPPGYPVELLFFERYKAAPLSGPPSAVGVYIVQCWFYDPNNPFRYTWIDSFMEITKGKPEITWKQPPVVAPGSPIGAASLNATANVDGTFFYTDAETGAPISAATVYPVGAHKLAANFLPEDTERYQSTVAFVTLRVGVLPRVTSELLLSGNLGDQFTYVMTGDGNPAPALALPEGLPEGLGLSLQADGVTISGTLLISGGFSFTVQASSVIGDFDAELFLAVKKNGNSNTPQINSDPIATPNPALAGTPVQFTVSAIDSDGQHLAYFWDFGDGATSRRQNPTHTYTAAKKYTVKVTASDGVRPSGTKQFDMIVAAASSKDIQLISKASMTIDFVNPTKSVVTLAGTVTVPNPIDKTRAILKIGDGFTRDYILNAKGAGGNAYNIISVKVAAGGITTSRAKLAATAKNPPAPAATLLSELNDLGFTNATVGGKGAEMFVPISLKFVPFGALESETKEQADTVRMIYKAVKNKKGTAKK